MKINNDEFLPFLGFIYTIFLTFATISYFNSILSDFHVLLIYFVASVSAYPFYRGRMMLGRTDISKSFANWCIYNALLCIFLFVSYLAISFGLRYAFPK